MSEGSLSRKVTRSRGRSRRRKSKGGLSEIFDKNSAMQTGKGMVSGMLGGAIVKGTESTMKSLPPWSQNLVLFAGSFVAGTMLQMPNVSAGMSGALAYKLMDQVFPMNEDGDWADQDALDEEEEYMDEAGNPMFLADDGNFYYLEDDMMGDEDEDMMDEDEDEDGMSEPTFLAAGIPYPSYVNTSRY